MQNKKGQAAMEFLMTYGWAILAAIVVIAVLAIYFRPSQLVTNNQVMTAPFNALGTVLTGGNGSTGVVQLEFKNNGADAAALGTASLSITTPSGETCGAATFSDADLQPGETTVATFNSCTFGSGDTLNANVAVTYTSGEGSLNKTASGTIAGKAA